MLAFAAAAAVLGKVDAARADLRESSERLARAWRASGAVVVLDRTRFLDEDETTSVTLPNLPAAECTTVVFLGPRGLGFHIRVIEAGDEEAGRKLPSEAGAVSLERCGDGPPVRIRVSSDSGRGAIETILARSAKPLAPLRVILPERTGGVTVPGPDPGILPTLASPENRAEIAEGRARLDGGFIEARRTWQSGPDGSGTSHETLEPGCHRLRLLALDRPSWRTRARAGLDLDAEMRDEADDRLLARDRSDAPDAELSLCVGETTQVEVVFVGSPPDAPVLLVHAWWSLPQSLPAIWGSEARARMARLLLARQVRSLPRWPFMLAQGGAGGTPVPVSIEPGGCYLAVVSLVEGTARAVALRVHLGGEDVFDDRGIDDLGAAVAFCAHQHERAVARVEVRGAPPLGWGLAIYRIADGVWQGSR